MSMLSSGKNLSEDVCNLRMRRNVGRLHSISIHLFSDEMIINVHVLDSFMMNWIRSYGPGSLVVIIEDGSLYA